MPPQIMPLWHTGYFGLENQQMQRGFLQSDPPKGSQLSQMPSQDVINQGTRTLVRRGDQKRHHTQTLSQRSHLSAVFLRAPSSFLNTPARPCPHQTVLSPDSRPPRSRSFHPPFTTGCQPRPPRRRSHSCSSPCLRGGGPGEAGPGPARAGSMTGQDCPSGPPFNFRSPGAGWTRPMVRAGSGARSRRSPAPTAD